MEYEESFERRKKASLQALINACEHDKSPKGSVDEPIRTLVDMLNNHPDFATTSSCSGRISVFHTGGSDTNKKGRGHWLLALHRQLENDEELENAIKEGLMNNRDIPSTTLVKHEPFVLHVMCKTVARAQSLLKLAMDAGFRESGISVGSKKIMVGIRTTSNAMECPIAKDNEVLCSSSFIKFLAAEANKRFAENVRRTQYFEKIVHDWMSHEQSPFQQVADVETTEINPKEWRVLPQCQLKRWGHTATPLEKNRVLIFGGWGEESGEKHTHLSNSLIWDAYTQQTREAIGKVAAAEPPGRVYHTATAVADGSVIIFGGRKSPVSPYKDFCRFDSLSETWSNLQAAPNCDSPAARWRHATVFSKTDGCLYTYGGRGEQDTVFSDMWSISIEASIGNNNIFVPKQITNTTGVAPGPRFAHAMIATESAVLLHGGLSSLMSSDGQREIFIFDLKQHTWSMVQPTPVLEWRFSHAWLPLSTNKSIIFGGLSKQYSRSNLCATELIEINMESFEMRSIQVRSFDSILTVQHDAVAVSSPVGGSPSIISFGGGATCFAFGSIFGSSASLSLTGEDNTSIPAVVPTPGAADSAMSTVQPLPDKSAWFFASNKANAVQTKKKLAEISALDKARKVVIDDRNRILFPINTNLIDLESSLGEVIDLPTLPKPENKGSAVPSIQQEAPLSSKPVWFFASNKANAVQTKKRLSEIGALDKARKVVTDDRNRILFPINTNLIDVESSLGEVVSVSTLPSSGNSKGEKTKSSKQDIVSKLFGAAKCKFEKVDDVLLIHSREISLDRAQKEITPSNWMELLEVFPGNPQRIVWGSEIDEGPMRKSRNRLLFSAKPISEHDQECWVSVAENGVKFSYDMLRCMYSKGNVAEKLRFAQLIKPGEIVVDLFAGIGYFTVPALKITPNCKLLHACEWNPDAVRALRRNLKQNGVQSRCIVYPGDCRQLRLVGDDRAHRISLGLIPDSKVGWETAVSCLSDNGGWLHVHGNAPETDIESFGQDVAKQLTILARSIRGPFWAATCTHVQKVKSYAPRVLHLVADIRCGPPSFTGESSTPVLTVKLEDTKFRRPISKFGEELADNLRRVADEMLCGANISRDEAYMLAADGQLLMKRVHNSLKPS